MYLFGKVPDPLYNREQFYIDILCDNVYLSLTEVNVRLTSAIMIHYR